MFYSFAMLLNVFFANLSLFQNEKDIARNSVNPWFNVLQWAKC